VEFIGIWGSGKTTLINNVSMQFQKKGLKVAKFSDFSDYVKTTRYTYIVLLFLFNPLYIFKWLIFIIKFLYILRPSDKLQIDIFKTLVKTHIIKNVILKIKKPDILLWEGAYHLLPMFARMNKLKYKDVLFSASTLFSCQSNYVVFIDADISLSKKRVERDHENGVRRFNNYDLNRLRCLYVSMVSNQDKIRDVLNLSSAHILTVDGKESLSKKTNYLLNLIR
jgi:thymidylate kinase